MSLTSASIHWPGKYLVSPSHRERRWPSLRLQTAEILSQLQDYYLVVRAGEHCGSVFMLPGLPAGGGKMNQRACGGRSGQNSCPLASMSLQLLSIDRRWLWSKALFYKSSRITPGNGSFWPDHLLVFSHPSPWLVCHAVISCVQPTLWRIHTLLAFIKTGRHESQPVQYMKAEWNSLSREKESGDASGPFIPMWLLYRGAYKGCIEWCTARYCVH